jgi:hypothetical protein
MYFQAYGEVSEKSTTTILMRESQLE